MSSLGLELIYLAFWARLLTITSPRFCDVTNIPKSTRLCSSLPGDVNADYYTSLSLIVSRLMFTIKSIHTGSSFIYIHSVGSIFIQCIAYTGSYSPQLMV